MKTITRLLMKYQLNKAKKEQDKATNLIVKEAYDNLIQTYKDAIMYLE